MVAIKDMTIPTCCMNCELLGKEKIYCSVYPRKDLDIFTVATDRPNWCPLVEIEERKVSKWAGDKAYPVCPKCGCNVIEEYISCTDYAEIYKPMKFCPNCGEEMEDNNEG